MKKAALSLQGVENFRREIALMNEGTRKNVKGAIKKGTDAVRDGAINRVPKRSGELAYTIRSEFSANGLTGFAKAGYGRLLRRSRARSAEGIARFKARREQQRLQRRLAPTSKMAQQSADLGVYAPIIERGDRKRNKPAKPYMVPAFRQEKPTIMSDVGRALQSGAKTAEARINR